ncbi:MAG: hypothetical protein AB1515_02805 [Nitrospirota bacterium]
MRLPQLFGRTIAYFLFILLTLQLSGFTCMNDLWASPDGNGGADVVAFSMASSSDGIDAAAFPHDDGCPCHMVVTHLSGMMQGSSPYAGEFALPASSPVIDNLPSSLFRPPVVRS